ncbi:UNVERIFIED_CONTAM: hypothetical protein FKN15_053095 [Acipenser sinensis]
MAAALIAFAEFLNERAFCMERVFKDRHNSLENLNNIAVFERLRFHNEDVLTLVEMLKDDLEPATNRSHSIPAIIQVCVAIRFYATGSFLNVVGDFTGIHKSSASRIVHRVSQSLKRKLNHFITFSTDPSKLRKLKGRFYEIAGFPNVVGAVDGTHIKIQAPYQNENIYVNRKGYHSINVQIISDPNLLISNIVAQWPGSTHDSRILLNSSIHTAFDRGIVQGFLHGESGYALKPWLMTPYLNPQSPAQANYNRAHSKTRNTVERCIGVWKRRFHILHREIRMAPDRVCAIICATAALHNFARYG